MSSLEVTDLSVRFGGQLAVGGVTPENLATWIQAGCAGAGLGSDLYRAGQAVERTREQAERFISASKS